MSSGKCTKMLRPMTRVRLTPSFRVVVPMEDASHNERNEQEVSTIPRKQL